MVRNFNGVLARNTSGYELFTHKSTLNLSEELELIWQQAIPVSIKIANDYKTLFRAKGNELYYDKGSSGGYQLHINEKNLDEFLQEQIGQLLYITLDYGEGQDNGTEYSKS